MKRIAIIGGTGLYSPEILADVETVDVQTPYGSPVSLKVGSYSNLEVVFLARHGYRHAIPPHKINYKANMAALQKMDVGKIFATAAVGSLNLSMAPGHLAFLDQFIDFTKGRDSTYFDGGEAGVAHADLTFPYCTSLREILSKAAEEQRFLYHQNAVYICTEGPRFETPAEIRMFRAWGADLVGMTNVPEVVLARELGICYSAVALVTNYAAGISPGILTHEEVMQVMAENINKVRSLLMRALQHAPKSSSCGCMAINPLN
jgi:5'-methylthioadenosine phosphorylase